MIELTDADLTIVDLNGKSTIENKNMNSKVGWTPFDGKELLEAVSMTVVRGTIVMKDGSICATLRAQRRLLLVFIFRYKLSMGIL